MVKAALHALTRWVRDGVAPRSSAPIELGDAAAPDPIVRDAFGIAKGGIRLPQVEAPTARINGLRNDVPPGAPEGQNFCFLFGRTEPLDAATLAKAYPTHESFVRRFNAAVDEIVRLGYWLKPEGASPGLRPWPRRWVNDLWRRRSTRFHDGPWSGSLRSVGSNWWSEGPDASVDSGYELL